MKHLGFTGTKKGIGSDQRKALQGALAIFREKGYLWMHNGDCIGADATAALLWRRVKGKIYLHPPIKTRFRANLVADISCEPLDYLARDRHIAESSEVLVATPSGFFEEVRSGTWTTVRYARKLRRHIFLVFPDGTVRKE